MIWKNLQRSLVVTGILLGLIIVAVMSGSLILNNSVSIGIAIVGAILAFAGNNLVIDSSTRFDAKTSSEFKRGNMLQTAGYFATILALIIK